MASTAGRLEDWYGFYFRITGLKTGIASISCRQA